MTILAPEVSDLAQTDERPAKALPDPSGYRLLVALPEVEEKTEGGIIKPEQAKREEQIASVIAFVLKVGPDAYKDEKRFPSGPWCKEGDFILIHAFSGSRIVVFGKEFRFINDDTVLGTVEDPRGIRKA